MAKFYGNVEGTQHKITGQDVGPLTPEFKRGNNVLVISSSINDATILEHGIVNKTIKQGQKIDPQEFQSKRSKNKGE